MFFLRKEIDPAASACNRKWVGTPEAKAKAKGWGRKRQVFVPERKVPHRFRPGMEGRSRSSGQVVGKGEGRGRSSPESYA